MSIAEGVLVSFLWAIHIGVLIYLILLAARLVNAMERIADKVEQSEKI
jgi:Ca2+/Na+ antiporter